MGRAGWSPRGVNMDLLPQIGQEAGLWIEFGDTVKGPTLKGWWWW